MLTRNMLNDPETYPSPATFDPTRYLATVPQRDPRTICFGFGRRACPGRELAETSIFLFVAMTLATFDITRGAGSLPLHENSQGTIRYAELFTRVSNRNDEPTAMQSRETVRLCSEAAL